MEKYKIKREKQRIFSWKLKRGRNKRDNNIVESEAENTKKSKTSQFRSVILFTLLEDKFDQLLFIHL